MKNNNLTTVIVIIIVIVSACFTYKKETLYNKLTKVEINNNPYNFGTITNSDSIAHNFRIKNITNTLLIIEKVLPSCPCTKVTFNKKSV